MNCEMPATNSKYSHVFFPTYIHIFERTIDIRLIKSEHVLFLPRDTHKNLRGNVAYTLHAENAEEKRSFYDCTKVENEKHSATFLFQRRQRGVRKWCFYVGTIMFDVPNRFQYVGLLISWNTIE